MKRQILLYLSVILLVLYNPMIAMDNKQKSEQNIGALIDKWLPTVYTAAWASTIAAETLSFTFAPIRYVLYGNNPIAESSAQTIRKIINSTGLVLQQPLDIKASRTLWTSLGENMFAHQGTLFVNSKIFNQPNFIMSDELKKEILYNAAAISSNYDAKILAASMAVPLTIWTIAHYTHALIQKLNESEKQSSWSKRAAEIAEKCKKSFYIKTGVSLGLITGYILYQKYLISKIAGTLLARSY